MSDGPSLLAAIRDHPEEDAPRHAFADWLQEQDDAESRWLGEFISSQLAGVPWEGPLLSDKLIGLASLGWPRYRMQLHHTPNVFSAAVEYYRGPEDPGVLNEPRFMLAPLLHINRGFVHAAELNVDELLQEAGPLFARHPVQSVILTDCVPTHHAIGREDGVWYLAPPRQPKISSFGGWGRQRYEIDASIFDLLDAEEQKTVAGTATYKTFKTQSAAIDALGAAAMLYATRRRDEWLAHNSP